MEVEQAESTAFTRSQSTEELLGWEWMRDRESRARTYANRVPFVVTSASGAYLRDQDGRTYLDCLTGAGTLALGHDHAVVRDAVQEAMRSQHPWHALDLTTPAKLHFVDTLFRTLPASFSARARIHFCSPSGADAVEAAAKLVRIATGRQTIVVFRGSYHGVTAGALAMTTDPSVRSAAPPSSGVVVAPYPYSLRCPFGVGGDEGAALSARYLERLLDDDFNGFGVPAGVLLEVVQGEGGVIPAPDWWIREVRRITAERSIPLIVDEIQTGCGRTGRLYAFEHAGITPDVILLSKAIGGALPLSVLLYDESLDCWTPGAHVGTFRGNQLAMVAGAAALSYIVAEELPARAAAIGAQLTSRITEAVGATPYVAEVRGRGLMIGIELVEPAARDRVPRPAGALALAVQAAALERGLLVERGGRGGSVVRFLPPLTLTHGEAEQISDIFAAALADATTAHETWRPTIA